MKFWFKNILPLHKNILNPINPNKTLKGIEKIEKKICSVFNLVLIFGCNSCEFIFKIYGFNFLFLFKISGFSFWFGFSLYILQKAYAE